MAEKYCEECQNLSDLCYHYEDEIRDLRVKVSRLRWLLAGLAGAFCVVFVALVLAAGLAFGAEWPMLAPDGTRAGTVRERFGDPAVDVFDAESNRLGWGRRNRDGTVELFDKDGRRTGTVDRNGVLRTYQPAGKGKR